MLINLSSLSSISWDKKQINLALSEFESILDIEFPIIEHNSEEKAIKQISDYYVDICVKHFSNADKNNAVHIKGEHIFTFCFVNSMLNKGFRCIASVLEIENNSGDIELVSPNKFVGFREYRLVF